MITATIVKDSVTPSGKRLTTFVLTYPRFIHAEFMTHRCFSRNAASSRAIPIKKMIEAVIEEPALPEFWGYNQSGMQALEQMHTKPAEAAFDVWIAARNLASESVRCLEELNVHKQLSNRLIEPWSHITVIATASDAGLRNFFGLRAHKDAQPEFQVLAYRMLYAWLNCVPAPLQWGEWHVPFDLSSEDYGGKPVSQDLRLAVATGRIARVSYLTHDGIRDPHEDFILHDKLLAAGHWSPFEHCAMAETTFSNSNFGEDWRQYRKRYITEVRRPCDEELKNVLADRPKWFTL